MTHPILGLGHVGLFVHDLDRSVRFWRDLIGFQVTDGSVEQGVVFLSTRPEEEHHMLLLRRGRDAPSEAQLIQQVSFRADSLQAVADYSRRLRHENIATMDVSHGNAVGVYFRDPDGNKCEIYWQTGIPAHQVYKKAVNLSLPADAVLGEVRDHTARFAETGYAEETPFLTAYPPAPAPSA